MNLLSLLPIEILELILYAPHFSSLTDIILLSQVSRKFRLILSRHPHLQQLSLYIFDHQVSLFDKSKSTSLPKRIRNHERISQTNTSRSRLDFILMQKHSFLKAFRHLIASIPSLEISNSALLAGMSNYFYTNVDSTIPTLHPIINHMNGRVEFYWLLLPDRRFFIPNTKRSEN